MWECTDMKNYIAIIIALVLITTSLGFRTYSAEKRVKNLTMHLEIERVLAEY